MRRAVAETQDPPPTPAPVGDAVLEIRDLAAEFVLRSTGGGTIGRVRAVDGVTFQIERAESFGLVGESGCGKTTLARTILGLEPKASGQILLENQDVAQLSGKDLQRARARMQIIFQDPFQSLDPRMPLGRSVEIPLKQHKRGTSKARRGRVAELLDRVGLDQRFMDRYPHECSGGQLQRVGIARALALDPSLLIADEPTSALDVSVQAQVLNLIHDLRDSGSLAMLFISHDLEVVRHVCSRIAVMYLGKLVEVAARDELFENPLHPYTRALLSCAPSRDPLQPFTPEPPEGELPSPIDPPSGCSFHPRCPIATDSCRQVEPELREVRPGHWVSCIHVGPS